MRLGLHALGIGAGAKGDVIDSVAIAAEHAGFATLWSGEHVVMVDESASRYPYSADGQIAVPSAADWLDPMIGLSFVAAATLDTLSGGRFTMGIGVGWSREEFEALGVPFERRSARTAEYVAAIRTLWRDDVASFGGEFVGFESVRVNPKPVRAAGIPIVLGGNSDAALRRVAEWGDGWYGFNVEGPAAAAEHVAKIRAWCEERGRNAATLRLAVALRDPHPSDAAELVDLGIDELVLVEGPPDDAAAAADWVADLAARWLPVLS
ncbi:LLM class F420-dependent oxidoreductase [Mycobacterium antarcticum]|uniref:TIGR03619 family F420-dependent LLM class oxidoreductase n=1 Tax=unclassified Mycolicibacterium TaxID=2636767 RepID=UPI00238A7B99|nr:MULTISPECIES: TIGR03619 family F420-dependent LLM class oxidoreductase [unclassified Mycolicibacterium]GLP76710.1 LLM class F420-dependent oxidoreductase [Mycolicibacterium sp. TUM20983]GLP82853.1 LLM class F420-dependent oxidoreductase [Mycolicibacterium sp. TUM20984]